MKRAQHDWKSGHKNVFRLCVTVLLEMVLMVGVTGCGSSLQTLLKTGQYDEALCKVQRFGGSETDKKMVQYNIVQKSDVAIHLSAVSQRQLGEVLGEQMAEKIYSQVSIIRVIVDPQFMQLRQVYTAEIIGDSVAVENTNGANGSEAKMTTISPTRENLARLTGERLPQATQSYSSPSRVDRLGAAVTSGAGGWVAAFFEAITLGAVPVTEILGYGGHGTRSYYSPTDNDYLRTAPAAEKLYRSLYQVNDRGRAGENAHTLYLLVPRTLTGKKQLVIVAGYDGQPSRGQCRFGRRVVIALGSSGALEDDISTMFKSTPRRLNDLPIVKDEVQ